MLLLRFIVERKIRYLKLSLSVSVLIFRLRSFHCLSLFRVSPSAPTDCHHLRFNDDCC